jgi:hypothetical protein
MGGTSIGCGSLGDRPELARVVQAFSWPFFRRRGVAQLGPHFVFASTLAPACAGRGGPCIFRHPRGTVRAISSGEPSILLRFSLSLRKSGTALISNKKVDGLSGEVERTTSGNGGPRR